MKNSKMFTTERFIRRLAAALAVLIIAVSPVFGCAKREKNDDVIPDPASYSVTFDSNGGSSVPMQIVSADGLVQEPTAPTNGNYVFGGWHKTPKLKVLWNFASDRVNADMTLYAKWNNPDQTDGRYTVKFDSNGGSTVQSQKVDGGGYATEPPAPTRDGYDFVCWCADSATSTAWNFAVDAVNSNITLYAKWNKKNAGGDEPTPTPTPSGTATATFNVGLEARLDGASNPPAQKPSDGKLVPPTVERDGYEVAGWYVEDRDEEWNFDEDILTADTTLFARWKTSGETVEYTPAPTICASGKIYIHYLRPAADYSGWTAYVWSDTDNETYSSSYTDESGLVFEVDPADYGFTLSANSTFKFIITQPNWNKDGDDNTVTVSKMRNISGSYHWFVQQGRTNNGSNTLTVSSGGTGGTAETEPKRESRSNVNRANAAALNVANGVTGYDETGVGYQIFVAPFCDSDGDGVGDLRGIISKLDYLDSLSVDILWLTPIQSSDSYHGYDCYDYYSIDPKFGTNADYRELVFKAHQRGMKIIMDLVVNHTSTRNEWFIKSKQGVIETVTYQDGTTQKINYRDFYRWKNSGGYRYNSAGDGWYYYSSFNSSMPELNYDYQPARDAMTDVAMYWMAYGLDGFRMDAIKHMFMWEESENAPTDVQGAPNDTGYVFNMTKDIEFFKEFNHRLKAKYPNCFLLGENLTGDVNYVAPFYAGMDSLFDFNTYFDLPSRINNGNATATASAFNDNAAKYTAARGGVGRAINGMISSNHDKPRLSYVLGSDTAKMKLYTAVIMTMPGLGWIYYGDEIGLKSAGNGDDTYRQSMKWTGDWQNKCTAISDRHYNDSLASVADQSTDDGSMLSFVRAVTKVRNDNPVLINGTATCSAQGGVLKITVTDGTNTVVAYHNFTGTTKTVSQSGTAVYGGSTLGAYGSAVYKI